MTKVYIGLIPKDQLLYELYQRAKPSNYFRHCKELLPKLEFSDVRRDLYWLIVNKSRIDFTVYYGKMLYIDITDNYVDTTDYNARNGCKLAEFVINLMKLITMRYTLLTYHKM